MQYYTQQALSAVQHTGKVHGKCRKAAVGPSLPRQQMGVVPRAAQARPVRTGTLPSWWVAGAVMAAWVAC